MTRYTICIIDRNERSSILTIVDIHSHCWSYPAHFNDDFRQQAVRARRGIEFDLTVRYEAYRAAAPTETVTVVFGGKAQRSGLWVDDGFVADYVAQNPSHLIGFLSVDPTQPNWQDELRRGHQELVGERVQPGSGGRGTPEPPRQVAVEEVGEPARHEYRRCRVRRRARLHQDEHDDDRDEENPQNRDRVRPAEPERAHPLPDVVLRKSLGPNDAVYM